MEMYDDLISHFLQYKWCGVAKKKRRPFLKRNQSRFINHCLIIGLIASLIMVVAACSKSTSPTSSTAAPTFDYFIVTPTNPANLPIGSTRQFTATATYSNGSTMDISSQVTWTSSNTNIAAISSTGLVTGIADGTTNIIAAISGITSMPVNLTIETATSTTSTTTTTIATTTTTSP